MSKGSLKVRIPNPHQQKDVGISLLEEILRQAGITKEEWESTKD
jgi:predicted RNA binding protein YcfA (HicA-like mRNA interferase family)